MSKTKRIMYVFSLILLFISFGSYAQGSETTIRVTKNPIRISIDGKESNVGNISYGGTTYVNLEDIVKVFNKDISWKANSNIYFISNPEDKIINQTNLLNKPINSGNGNKSQYINAARSNIKLNVYNIDISMEGFQNNVDAYIPVRKIAEVFNRTVGWNNETKVVSIDSKTLANIKYYTKEESLRRDHSWNEFLVGNIEESYNGFKKLLNENPFDPVFNSNMGRVLFEKGDYNGSIQYFKMSLNDEYRTNVQMNSLYYIGEGYYNLSEYKKANESFKEVVKYYNDTVGLDVYIEERTKAVDYIWKIYFNLSEYEEAKEYFQELVKFCNDTSESDVYSITKAKSLYYIGESYYNLSEYEKAKEYYQESIELEGFALGDTNNSDAKLALALLEMEQSIKWKIFETDNIIFKILPNTNIKDIKKYIERNIQGFEKNNKIFKAELKGKKITLYQWNDDEDVLKYLEPLEMELSFAMPERFIIHQEWGESLGVHELIHVIVGNMSRKGETSNLINEGIACYFDESNRNWNSENKRYINEAKIDYISIKELWLKWPGEFMGKFRTYPLAALFVEHLIEMEGIDKFIELARDQSYNSAKKIYGENIDKYIIDFEEKIFKR